MALIFILSSGALPSFRISIPHFDKIAHLAVYGVLGFLLGRAAAWTWGWSWVRAAWFAVVIASLYGITDEAHQSHVPGRSVEIADWLADTVGAALAQIPLFFWKRRRGQSPDKRL
jgi:VanZ family protein